MAIPLLLQLLLLYIATAAAAPCQAPFARQLGRCLMVERRSTLPWCQANRLCWQLGGSLMAEVSLMLPSTADKIYGGNGSAGSGDDDWVWLGASDLELERLSARDGWRFIVTGKQLPSGIWTSAGGPASDGDCVGYNVTAGALGVGRCSDAHGYACLQERHSDDGEADGADTVTRWQRVGFARSAYNNSGGYCWSEAPAGVAASAAAGATRCIQAAIQHPYPVRSAIYNGRAGLCRLVEFADAQQVEWEIENSEDWVKYSRAAAAAGT